MRLHLARYEWAASVLADNDNARSILDAACGVGYGSAVLASSMSGVNVTGADIDAAAVDYAKQRYHSTNVQFIHSNILNIASEEKFDAIVSLETIEHVPDPVAVIGKFSTLLNKDGILILSVPVTPSVDVNPYHLTDFTAGSIRKILRNAGFDVFVELTQIQRYSPVKIARKQESRLDDMRSNLGRYYLTHPVAMLKRAYATLRFGFTNRYLTLASRKLS